MEIDFKIVIVIVSVSVIVFVIKNKYNKIRTCDASPDFGLKMKLKNRFLIIVCNISYGNQVNFNRKQFKSKLLFSTFFVYIVHRNSML